MTQPDTLKHLLHAVSTGELSPETAFDKLKYLNFEPVDDFAHIDHHRALRTGFPEVIWGLGKTPDQIAQIMQVMRDRAAVVMATRIEPDVYTQVKSKVPDVVYYATARICALRQEPGVQRPASGVTDPTSAAGRSVVNDNQALEPATSQPPHPHPGSINILSAGTADLPVAEEAAVTAELCGFKVNRLWDVGVSGIHRLLNNRWAIAEADV